MKVTGLRGSTVASWSVCRKVLRIEIIIHTRFDYYSFNAVKRQEDEEGLRKAAKWIHNLIEKEITESNISSDRIVVGGISQGGAVSLLTGLTTERPLAGIFCLSTYIPLRSKVPEVSNLCFQSFLKISQSDPRLQFATAQARTLPILWCHGNIDMKMDVDVWKDLAETLAGQLGIPFRTSTENSTASRKLDDDSDWKNYVMDLARDLGIESPAGLNSTSANHSSVNELLLVERGKGELHFRTYRGLGHKLDDKELRDLALWLSTLIPPA